MRLVATGATTTVGFFGLVLDNVDQFAIDTLTGKTQWTRPGGDAFVIPLGLIQVSRIAEASVCGSANMAC